MIYLQKVYILRKLLMLPHIISTYWIALELRFDNKGQYNIAFGVNLKYLL